MPKQAQMPRKQKKPVTRKMQQPARKQAAPRPSQPYSGGKSLVSLNAHHSSHLALPRPTASYSVIKTIRRFNSAERCMLLGTFKYGDDWTSICAASGNKDIKGDGNDQPMSGDNNCVTHTFPMGDGWAGVSATPSACTVTVTNPNALIATSGMAYAGRCSGSLTPEFTTNTWNEVFEGFINTASPRITSAATLALDPLSANCIPSNMGSLAEFTMVRRENAIDGTTQFTEGEGINPSGFAPLYVYNPNTINLEYLVCTEWRVRFDPNNPASGGHTYHPPASTGLWDGLMRSAYAASDSWVTKAEEAAGRAVYRFGGRALGALESGLSGAVAIM